MVKSQIFEEFQFCAKHKNYILSKTDILHNKLEQIKNCGKFYKINK